MFLLLSTASHTGVDQYGIHDAKYSNYEYSVLTGVDESKSLSHADKESVEQGIY